MPKKSFYVFLSSLLGVMLFLILHRTVVFSILYFIAVAQNDFGASYYQFLFWDYFTLILSLMFGCWYGIWLGMYWYEKVYAEKRGGLVDSLARHLFSPKHDLELEKKLSAARERIEKDVMQIEELASDAATTIVVKSSKKPKVVRRKTVKRTS